MHQKLTKIYGTTYRIQGSDDGIVEKAKAAFDLAAEIVTEIETAYEVLSTIGEEFGVTFRREP